MDERHDQDFETWIRDARERGFPASFTGVVLFRVVLGIPFWATALLMGLLMVAVLVGTARHVFGHGEPEPDSW